MRLHNQTARAVAMFNGGVYVEFNVISGNIYIYIYIKYIYLSLSAIAVPRNYFINYFPCHSRQG